MTRVICGYIAVEYFKEKLVAWLYQDAPEYSEEKKKWYGSIIIPLDMEDLPEELQNMKPGDKPVYCSMLCDISDISIHKNLK